MDEEYVQLATFLILLLTDHEARFKYDLQNLSIISYATRASLHILYGVTDDVEMITKHYIQFHV